MTRIIAIAIVLLACSAARNVAAEQLVPSEPSAEVEAVALTSVFAAPDATLDAFVASDSSSSEPAAADSARKPGLEPRARRAVGNFFSDGWVIVTSPTRVRGTGLLWLGLALGAEAAIYANDQEIYDAIVRNREAPVMKAALDVGDWIEPVGFMGRTNPIYVAALGAGYAFNVRPLRTIPTEILESHLLAGGVRNLGKALVGRRHPYENMGPYEFDFGHGTSFPSGHTSVAFELATIASMNARSLPVTIAAYSLATTLALQRVESRNHWPSDVFAAATYGTLVARTVVTLHERREKAGASNVSLLPHVSSDGQMVGLRLTRTF